MTYTDLLKELLKKPPFQNVWLRSSYVWNYSVACLETFGVLKDYVEVIKKHFSDKNPTLSYVSYHSLNLLMVLVVIMNRSIPRLVCGRLEWWNSAYIEKY